MDLTPYHRFVMLAQFDQLVIAHRKKVRAILDRLTAVDHDIFGIREEQERAAAKARELYKKRDQLELESKTINQELSQKRKKIENTADIKAYTALEHEIALLEVRKKELEETILDIWQQFEDQEQAVTELEASSAQRLVSLQELRVGIEAELQLAQKDLDELESHRSGYLSGIQPELLETYSAMREQYANPVVSVQENVCGGCGFPIPSGDRSQVFRHVLIPCQQCRRLLFDARVLPEIVLEEKSV